MSMHLESPQSESKMDTSDEVTTDSAGVSPLADDDDSNTKNCDAKDAMLRLDNREPEVRSLTPRRNERQLAQSHPLMAQNSLEMDSEKQLQSSIDLKCHNFPDVVPHSERLQAILIPDNVCIHNTLNTIRSNNGYTNTNNVHTNSTINKLRAHSPDLLSSESDADVSQYQAAVEVGFQAVVLVSNGPQQHNSLNKPTCRIRKSGDDISSLDSISNHSFDDDEDIVHNLASLSPSSSLIEGLDDDDDDCEGPELVANDDDDFLEASTPTPTARPVSPTAASVPQYSAAEERRDSRNWQKIVLPDGRMREIDMRVIEPYKRVLSHGGYLKAGGHNAIVIFCACHLPDRSRADYNYVMDNLFLYMVKTLEQLVTEDYVLIYLHGGSNRRNVPPFPWLKKCYQLIDRRLRKSLKNLYLVHPTFWIRSLVWMGRPFVSTKFWKKLIYVKSLQELGNLVVVEKAAIPEKVKQYDAKLTK